MRDLNSPPSSKESNERTSPLTIFLNLFFNSNIYVNRYASGPIQSRKTRKRKRKSSDDSGSSDVDENSREYDLNDPFIDDSEIIVEGGESSAPPERTGGGDFYVTKGNALPPSSSENKDNSSEASSPIPLNENTSNNKNQQYVEKHLRSLNFLPSEVCCSLSFYLSLSLPLSHTNTYAGTQERFTKTSSSCRLNRREQS